MGDHMAVADHYPARALLNKGRPSERPYTPSRASGRLSPPQYPLLHLALRCLHPLGTLTTPLPSPTLTPLFLASPFHLRTRVAPLPQASGHLFSHQVVPHIKMERLVACSTRISAQVASNTRTLGRVKSTQAATDIIEDMQGPRCGNMSTPGIIDVGAHTRKT